MQYVVIIAFALILSFYFNAIALGEMMEMGRAATSCPRPLRERDSP
jgi:hypothetical protein